MSDLRRKKPPKPDQQEKLGEAADKIIQETIQQIFEDLKELDGVKYQQVYEREDEDELLFEEELIPEEELEYEDEEEVVREDEEGLMPEVEEEPVYEDEKGLMYGGQDRPIYEDKAEPVLEDREKRVPKDLRDKELMPEVEEELVFDDEREMKGTAKRILTAVVMFFIILALVYGGVAFYFRERFHFNTEINGISVSRKTVSDVEAYLQAHVEAYELVIEERGGRTETIYGSEIVVAYKPGEEIYQFLSDQNPFLWITSLLDMRDTQITVEVEFDEAALRARMQRLNSVALDIHTDPVDAFPEYDGREFVIVPEELGSKVDTEILEQKLREFVSQLQPVLNLEENGCYILPRFTSESPEVIAATERLNGYISAEITYDLYPHTEVVDRNNISAWFSVDENMEVVFDLEGVEEFVRELKRQYDTVGMTRILTTPRGDTVQISGGDFGWIISQSQEVEALIADINNGEVVTREPKYFRRGRGRDELHDYGDTYALVDLAEQHMWFIRDGVVVLETPIVTGLPPRSATPAGSFYLTYKQSPAVLRGPVRSDGTREWETPVSYWMPFNEHIGFHDAIWQSSFGGDRYRTYGSNGCVNMPLDKARQLFQLIEDEMPVIVF